MDITNIGYANCIATDLVLTKAMSGRSGLVSYIKFVTSTEKGEVDGALIANPWQLGEMTEARREYTGEKILGEQFTAASTPVAVAVGWTPVVKGVFTNNGTTYDFKLIRTDDSSVTYGNFDSDGKIPAASQVGGKTYKAYYSYDNAYISAEQIPSIKAIREEISITAKPRRIKVEYSDLAAFEYKQETGADLGKALQTQAVAEMTYEIDCELVALLAAAGEASTTADELTAASFNDVCPAGVGAKDHYALLGKRISDCSNNIYKRTQKYVGNYLIGGPNVLTALMLVDGFKAAMPKTVAGPYFAGTYGTLKVYISPNIDADVFYVGFNGQDLDTSAVLFAPWMGLVPTQLLGFADGTMSQGWAIMYGVATLNNILVAKGQITHNALNSANTVYAAA